MTKFKCHGLRIIVGDLNARLHKIKAGEKNILGPYVFGNEHAADDLLGNRSLLMQLCI